MKVLELFAGTRSIGRAFERRGGHEVFSIDWDKQFKDIDWYADIGKITAKDIIERFGKPDVIWASPDCFPKGTLIWTDKGYKNVEDINCFDRVLTHNNRYRKVYRTMMTNKNDIYKIKISGCESIIVSSEHPYLARKKKRINTHKNGEPYTDTVMENPEWIKVKDLTNEYRVGIPINTESIIPEYHGCVYEVRNAFGRTRSHIENNLGKYMDNPNFWWLVGRYFGDGCLSKSKYTVDICCSKDENDEIIPVIDKLGIKYSILEKYTANHFCISNKELVIFLEQFGIGAKNKRITPMILNLPVELLREFLNGYISADGHWDNTLENPTCSITTVSKELAYGFQMCILKAFNRYGSLVVRDSQNNIICGRKVNTHPTYVVNFYKHETKRFQYKIENNVAWVNVRSVEKLPSEQTTVYNFSVEDDESYTANNIIVHNCTTFSVAAISKHRRQNPITKELEPISEYAKQCDEIDKHVIELIKELDPKFWFYENPRSAMRKMSWMQGLPRYTVTYCKYGDERMKPTDIWSNHPYPQFKPPCKNGDPCHVAAPRGSRTGTQGLKGHVERSRIPDALCDHIVDICEEWIDKDWRICSECGSVMEEGFIIEGFNYEYYCTEKCLHKHYSEEEYSKMYEADEAYWTQWY